MRSLERSRITPVEIDETAKSILALAVGDPKFTRLLDDPKPVMAGVRAYIVGRARRAGARQRLELARKGQDPGDLHDLDGLGRLRHRPLAWCYSPVVSMAKQVEQLCWGIAETS